MPLAQAPADNWILGRRRIALDARDHVWLIHRPKTLID